MHEVTILVELVKMVERAAKENNVKRIDTVVVQVGQLSSVIPRYMREYYPNTTEGTILEGSKIEIEMIPGNGLCHNCNKVFNVIKSKGKCPICKDENWELLSGKEFNLKEIIIEE